MSEADWKAILADKHKQGVSMREPIWTAENMNRKKGDTTFKTCGWCEWASCGSCKYDCHLDSTCSLMKDYGEEREVKWDTPCKLIALGKEDIKSIISSKCYEIKNSKDCIKRTQSEIKQLKSMKFEDKPSLPDSRGAEYFKLKDVVWVFHEKVWHRGICVPGYRTYDGCVSYVLDDYPDSAKGWGCGMSVPCVLLDWEYKYFKSHLEEFKKWLKMSDRKYNGEKLNLDEYYNSMTGGAS